MLGRSRVLTISLLIPDDNILVADYSNNRIQVFHQSGNHIKTIGTGQLSNPLGVCMDFEGKIIVSEGETHRISIF